MVFISQDIVIEVVNKYDLRSQIATYCIEVIEEHKKMESMIEESEIKVKGGELKYLSAKSQIIEDLINTAIWSFHMTSNDIEDYLSDKTEINFMLNYLSNPKYKEEIFQYLENMYNSDLLDILLPSHSNFAQILQSFNSIHSPEWNASCVILSNLFSSVDSFVFI